MLLFMHEAPMASSSALIISSAQTKSTAHADVTYLLLDGLRRPKRSQPHEVALCALGLTGDGTPRPLAARVALVEDEQAWRAMLGELKAGGIGDDVLLITCDGHPSLLRAIRAAFPDTPVQVSVTHELLGLSRRVDRRWRAQCLAEARQIFSAPDRATAVTRFRAWRDQWLKQGERAVTGLEADLASCLTFFRFPPSLWNKIRTVNLVERMFRQVRQSASLPTLEEVRPPEHMAADEHTPQVEIAPPVQPETGGTPAALPEPHSADASRVDSPAGAIMPIEQETRPSSNQETRPSSNGDAARPSVQRADLSADADLVQGLGQYRQTSARRAHMLMAIGMSLAGLMLGVMLSVGL